MGLFEKRRFKNFLVYVQDFKEDDPKTWKDMNPNSTPMKIVYDKFGLDPNTQDFTGHALALYRLVKKPIKMSIGLILWYFQR